MADDANLTDTAPQPTRTQAPEPLPYPGAVVQGRDHATFTLYAPGKGRASVIGSFNDWDPRAHPMEEIAPGLWSTRLRLDPGEHHYQFHVDDKSIGDPYARRLAPGSDDPPHAVLYLGEKPRYTWRNDSWDRPKLTDTIIYELHVADFSDEGTFNAVTERLSYFQDLGVNAIELMPVAESELEDGWGYQPNYFFACRRKYGTPEDLKRLIDEAHGAGIAVLLDIVLGHSGHQHPFNQLYEFVDSPWYGRGIGEENRYGLPSFDYRKPPTQAFMRDVQRYWLDEFHIDGLRYDYARTIGIDGDDGLPRLVRDAREARGDAWLIAEYLPEDPSIIPRCGFDAAWRLQVSHGLKGLARKPDSPRESFEAIVHGLNPRTHGYGAASQVINYLENHDENRLIHDLEAEGWKPDAARRRAAMIGTALLTAPGVPLIYQGQELGAATSPKPNERNPMLWHEADTEAGRGMFNHYARLIRLRREHPALRCEHFKLEAVHQDERWVAYHRWSDDGDKVTVALNCSEDTRRVSFGLPQPARWTDVIGQREVRANEHGQVELELKPHEAAVLLPADE